MHYHYYKKSRDLAWQVLSDLKISTMPISVLKICRSIGVSVIYNNDLEDGELGRSLIINDTPHILLRRDMSDRMKRFVCAHELGHHLLNHFSHGTEFSYTVNDRKIGFENSAEHFAMRLVSPSCVLWGCNIQTAQELAELCKLEYDYAERRMRRLKVLYSRNAFLTSALERDVYNNFQSFTENYRAGTSMGNIQVS